MVSFHADIMLTILWHNFSFREADLRAEQLEKKEIKLKQEVKEWEKKNAAIEAKHKEVRDELDEMESQLEGV